MALYIYGIKCLAMKSSCNKNREILERPAHLEDHRKSTTLKGPIFHPLTSDYTKL